MPDAESTAEPSPTAVPPEPILPMTEPAPTLLPPDCPPASASLHTGPVYRLVKSDPMTDEDFKTYFVLYPERKWKQQEACPAHGLSVRLTLETAVSEAARFKARIKGATWHVAMAVLDPNAGPIAQTFTKPEHHTWWPPADFNFLSAFSVQQNVIP